eukprot:Mrub_00675.p2 GENE.Mrub_00675~~Mrub_00675.p2  ORF type:complete len:644 (-),score=373.39 Mrub_00675:172-2103(-)
MYPKQALVKVHQLAWRDSRNCSGKSVKYQVINLPEKHKAAATLKKTLRKITGLSLFYRDDCQFRPTALLMYLTELKEAVYGPEPEKETDEDGHEKGTGTESGVQEQQQAKPEFSGSSDSASASTSTNATAGRKKQEIHVPETTLRGAHRKVEGLYQLVVFLEAEFHTYFAHYNKLLQEHRMMFDYLHMYFKKEQSVCFKAQDGTGLVGGEVTLADYRHGFCSSYFLIRVKTMNTDGKKFFHSEETVRIHEFEDFKNLEDLSVKRITEQSPQYQTLKARGAKFQKYALGSHYLAYTTLLYYRTWCSAIKYRAIGRCMVDFTSFDKLNPEYHTVRNNDEDEDAENEMTELPESKWWMCGTTLRGFSFACKKWGELVVEHLHEIQYDDKAYEQLVLAPERKTLIKSLVQNYQGSFKDIIEGKGGGCIFLLHGPPGVGKTLTAEAISELLRKPLYSVTVGELGTTISELEDKLRNILEVACYWDAVILLDEADIFLERRSDNDIHRNAMVGIFLRLLEYHNGVMFLTTNRVRRFDEAFHSRISIALHYEAHTRDSRAAIWRNLLQHAGLATDKLDIARLAAHDINGRQIKNVIRLSQTVVKDKAVQLDTKLFETNIQLTSAFLTDATSPDNASTDLGDKESQLKSDI